VAGLGETAAVDAHVHHAAQPGHGVRGVQRADRLSSGDRGADGDARRGEITDLAGVDDVRATVEEALQRLGERLARGRVVTDLRDAGDHLLDAILERDHAETR
jgi:hypothetical protein